MGSGLECAKRSLAVLAGESQDLAKGSHQPNTYTTFRRTTDWMKLVDGSYQAVTKVKGLSPETDALRESTVNKGVRS
jgi:hypothetical protein